MRMTGRTLMRFCQCELGCEPSVVFDKPRNSNAVRIFVSAYETPAMIGKLPFHTGIVMRAKRVCQSFLPRARIGEMMIRIKMIANYRAVLPPEAKHGVIEIDVPDGTTVYEAISRFDIPLNDESVIVLNGLTVDLNTPLKEGDMVTAFSAIAGG